MKDDRVLLRHMLDEINFIINETEGMEFEHFMNNEVLKRACSRSLEIIGEAAKNISPDFKKTSKDVEWKKISGLRDKIVHHYFGVNWDIMWDVMKNKIPQLKTQTVLMLNSLDKDTESIF